jgi:hypothetical protein
MNTAHPPPHGTTPPDHRDDDRLLFWLALGLSLGVAASALLVLKAAVLDRLVGPDLASRTILARLAILACDFVLLSVIYRQPTFRKLRGTMPFVAATAAACVAVTAIDAMLSTLLARLLLPGSQPILEQYPLLATVHRFTICVAWSIVDHALAQRSAIRRAAHRETEAILALRQSELARLGQQIEPHFLFNALSVVLACRHDPDAVEAVTTALADYLRFCLSRHGGPEPLAQELDAIELLLSVHEARFRGTLTCRVTSSPTARRVCVPPLLLDPLVDNALKFGGRTCVGPRTVVVEARVHGTTLVIEVTNSGSWVEPTHGRLGTGLVNLRRRLELTGLDARLEVGPGDGVVTARVVLPTDRCSSSPPPTAGEPAEELRRGPAGLGRAVASTGEATDA